MAAGIAKVQKTKKDCNSVHITIPTDVRDALEIKEGDSLLFKVIDGKGIIEKI